MKLFHPASRKKEVERRRVREKEREKREKRREREREREREGERDDCANQIVLPEQTKFSKIFHNSFGFKINTIISIVITNDGNKVTFNYNLIRNF